MRRPLYTWIAFGLCFIAALAAMGWISAVAVRLNRAETDARSQAELEENVRLALWRMDSAVGPLVAQESARPYFMYSAFYPADRAYGKMFSNVEDGDRLTPSPLLTSDWPYILLHFQFGPDGEVTSPQVPSTERLSFGSRGKVETAAHRLREFEELLDLDTVRAALANGKDQPGTLARNGENEPAPDHQDGQVSQQFRNFNEFKKRAEAQQTLDWNIGSNTAQFIPVTSNIDEGMMTPLWLNGTLMLARRILVDGEEYIQGCRLDWPAIRSRLLEEVQDLLPASDLEPVKDEASAVRGRKLASLPLILEPGELSAKLVLPGSSHTVPLIIAWVCFILAVLASATLLTAALSLSERRAAFVSAVTHELRTPLTTLRMYSEMLAEHMVPEEEKRTAYLNTLRNEADRLAHLVENVLAYARIERGAPTGRTEELTLKELLDRVKPRLVQRAQSAEMNLVFDVESGDLEQPLRLDPGAVDQILFNLVDNACKYAAGAADRAIHLKADLGSGELVFNVRDHGPGIRKKDRKRLFRPFSKSARDAADSARGVGLGLALSRRLARMMGGDLSLDESVRDGACFTLALTPIHDPCCPSRRRSAPAR